MLFGSLSVCTFQPGTFTDWGREGVKNGNSSVVRVPDS